jgi:hypothetical protein
MALEDLPCRESRRKRNRGVFERENGSGIYWVRFVDVEGKRKSGCVGNFSDAVNFYEAEKVCIRKRILAPIAGTGGRAMGRTRKFGQ